MPIRAVAKKLKVELNQILYRNCIGTKEDQAQFKEFIKQRVADWLSRACQTIKESRSTACYAVVQSQLEQCLRLINSSQLQSMEQAQQELKKFDACFEGVKLWGRDKFLSKIKNEVFQRAA